MKIRNVALLAMGVCLLGGTAWANEGQTMSSTDTLWRLGGTSTSQEAQSRCKAYLQTYLRDGLVGAECGEGVRSVSLITQTEKTDQDSVLNVHENVSELELHNTGAVDVPNPLFDEHRGEGERRELSDQLRGAPVAFFGSDMFGIMRPDVISGADNQIDIGFKFETKKLGALTKYSVPLTYHRRLNDGSELQVSWTPYSWNCKGGGFDNGGIKYKFNIFKNSDNALSFQVGCDFPTGTPRMSTIGLEPSLKFAYSYYLPEKWTLTANLGVASANVSALHKTYCKIEYGLDVSKSLDKDNFISLSYSGKDRNAVYYYEPTSKVTLGYGHTFDANNSLYFSIAHGCNHSGTDWQPQLSYSLKF